jgi:hypothetical protein
LFTGHSLHERVSPAKEYGQRYPAAVASGRRSSSRMHTGRESTAVTPSRTGAAPSPDGYESPSQTDGRCATDTAADEQAVSYDTEAGIGMLHNRLVGAGDWSTEYKGGYTPGWGPHVDAADAAAQVVRDKFASRHGSIREAFLCADTNKNGFVDRGELESLLQLCNLTPETASAMLRRFDENGDEEWSYKEFVQALKRKDYNAYQRGSPSPVKMQVAEESGPGVMPARASSVMPEERGFNLFTGHSLHERVSPAKEYGQRYPAAVASGRRSSSRMHTGRDSVSERYSGSAC